MPFNLLTALSVQIVTGYLQLPLGNRSLCIRQADKKQHCILHRKMQKARSPIIILAVLLQYIFSCMSQTASVDLIIAIHYIRNIQNQCPKIALNSELLC